MTRTLPFVLGLILMAHAQQFPSNEDIVARQFTNMLDSLNSRLPDSVSSVGFQAGGLEAGQRYFLRNRFNQIQSAKGFTVQGEQASFRFVFEKMVNRISYREPPARLFGFSSEVERQIDAFWEGWIEYGPGQTVYQTFSLSRSYKDTVNTQAIEPIEQSPYNIFKGQWVTRSVWTRYLEPAAVIVSVSVIVYLFFSKRS